MYKIAILGCENSHADNFLNHIYNKKIVDDVEVIGVYSDETNEANALKEKYGVAVESSYDAFVGKVDGIIITARNGKNHLPYAAPYIESGIPLFIDKPITNSEQDAVELMKRMKASGTKFSGGSSVPHAVIIDELAEAVKSKSSGEILGGFLRAPIDMDNEYGGFFFYSQHLTENTLKIFGYFPKSARAYDNGKVITVILRYDEYDVTMEYTRNCWRYYAYVSAKNEIIGGKVETAGASEREFMTYYNLLKGGEQKADYREFIAPVFVMNAINRSLESGAEEAVNEIEEI